MTAIPGYAEAVLNERRRRNLAELGFAERVCGVPVRPITPRDVIVLQECRCCWFDDSADRHDVVLSTIQLLWWQWKNRPKIGSAWLRRWFARRVSRLPADHVTDQVSVWLEWQFAEAPPGPAGSTGRTAPLASFATYLADGCAANGLSRGEILDTPVAILWQHVKLGMIRANPKFPKTNPSDRVKIDYLRSLQNGNRTQH